MTPTPSRAPARPRLKHAFTATAFAWVQVRNVWRAYFRSLAAERRDKRKV